MHTEIAQDQSHAKICQAQMRHGSKSFFAASRLLPRHIRADATALYAFCRVADDAIDLAPTASAQQAALNHLHERLRHIYLGTPLAYAEDALLCPIVFQHQIPKKLFEALLEGFAWDAQMRRYATVDELHHYATRVAGSVGIMMALMMGTRDTIALEHANALGAAMQLTNIARDVGEDARSGRIYLPLSWFEEQNVNVDQFLQTPYFDKKIAQLVDRLLHEADLLYKQARLGIQSLPQDCRVAILSAASVYGEIGQQVRRNRFDSVSVRAIVPLSRKLNLIARAALRNQFPLVAVNSLFPPRTHVSALNACHHLLAAVRDMRPLEPVAGFEASVLPSQRSFLGRTAWVLEMSERVAQHQREQRTAY